ncbi:MAG: hypothetical protein KatS3mg022_1565 [Armatimonadota bacterium]|nr:MAG: hypothetical protein KatS3mg022_1565 [Armatimonadota bacterium]
MCTRLVSLVGFWGVVCYLLFIVRAGYADPIRDACQRRDTWCSRKTFVWEVTASRSLRVSKHEREMLQSTPGNGEIAFHVWVSGQVAIMRRPGLTYVESVHQRVSHPWLLGRFSYWLGMGFVLYPPAETPNIYSPARALVLPVPGDGLYWGFIKDGPDELAPGMHPSFLAGTNPLRTFSPFFIFNWRQGVWVPEGRQGAVVVYRFSTPPVEAEIGLDATRQYAPVYFKAQQYTSRQEYKVREWQRLSGWWIPSKVEVQEVTSGTSSTFLYVLKQVQDTPSDMHIILPHGTPVKDMRHIPVETIAVEGLFVQKPVYSYTWSGSLPQKELLSVFGKESGPLVHFVNAPQPPREGTSVPLVLAAVGMAVVAGGMVYWLLRQRSKSA